MNFPVQLYVGDKSPERPFRPVSNDRLPVNKPDGGRWTSTWLGDALGSAWVQWCLNKKESWLQGDCYLITPRSGARIYVIDSLEDAQVLPLAKLPPMFNSDYIQCIDWLAVSRDYDAVHLTEKGQEATHLSFPLNLYGWDCESTVWFRDVFDKVEMIGKRVFQREE